MARTTRNLLTWKYSGKVGDEFVLKEYNDKSIITKYPDRSGVILSPKQRRGNDLFRQAVDFAKGAYGDPEVMEKLGFKKETAKRSAYHAAIRHFMINNSPAIRAEKTEKLFDRYLKVFPLTERQYKALRLLVWEDQLSNAVYQEINQVSKATATRDLQEMVAKGIVYATGRGAGAKYLLMPLDPEGGQ